MHVNSQDILACSIFHCDTLKICGQQSTNYLCKDHCFQSKHSKNQCTDLLLMRIIEIGQSYELDAYQECFCIEISPEEECVTKTRKALVTGRQCRSPYLDRRELNS
jgi:hypothetical protein